MTLPQEDQHLGALQRRILKLCEQRGWSRYELARRAGLKGTTVYSLFAPNRQGYSVRHDTAVKLATALDVPVATLFDAAPDDALTTLVQLWGSLTKSQRSLLIEFAVRLRSEQQV